MASNIASCALRSAGRLGASSRLTAAPVRRLSRSAIVAASRHGHGQASRGYVTDSKADKAKVETVIKLDKNDFADIPLSSVDAPTNAKISPMAGK